MAVTPEQVFRLQPDEEALLKKAEAIIDKALIDGAASGFERSIPVAIGHGWNKRVRETLMATYRKMGWKVTYREAMDQRDEAEMRFEPQGEGYLER